MESMIVMDGLIAISVVAIVVTALRSIIGYKNDAKKG